VPVAVGLKVMNTVQLLPGPTVIGLNGQLELTPKSLKLLATLVIDNGKL
jgi:hypothetical protein